MPTLGPGSQVYLKRTIKDLQPVVRTSKPYPLEQLDQLRINTPMLVGGKLRVEPVELDEITLENPVIASGVFRSVKLFNTIPTEELDVTLPQIESGVFSSILIEIQADLDDAGVPRGLNVAAPQLASGRLSRILIEYVIETEEMQLNNPTLVEGTHE